VLMTPKSSWGRPLSVFLKLHPKMTGTVTVK
jgi:hypothetical protein